MSLHIRPAGPIDAEALAAVQRISWRATYGTLLSPGVLARAERVWGVRYWLETLDRVDDRVVTLVVDGPGDGVVGFCVAGARRRGPDPVLGRYGGEIYQLYILPGAQGKGLGGALMTAAARVLRARGMESALVWALSGNRRAIDFYRHLGGSFLTEVRKPFFGEPVIETAIGWPDISLLSGSKRRVGE